MPKRSETISYKPVCNSLFVYSLLLLIVGNVVLSTSSSPAGEYDQAPMLDQDVEAGTLPPVEERIPESPRVVKPRDRVGKYGGRLTMVTVGGGSSSDVLTSKVATLFKFSPDTEEVVSDVAKGYDISDNYKKYTIYLRKGLKWSDGHEYTAEDVIFWWKDIMLNKDLKPVLPSRYKTGDERAELKKLDEYTVQWQFADPNPMFTMWFHGWANHGPTQSPKHYLKQFHKKYNPEVVEEAKSHGFDTWANYFKNKRSRPGWQVNFDLPRLQTWIPVKSRPSYKLYERNPYFHQVDAEGNQLPYIDRLLVIRCNSPRIALGKMAFGQVDVASATVNLEDYSLLKSFEKESGLQVHLLERLRGGEFVFSFNLSSPDPVKRDIFRDVRFRRAVSLAIDREEINRVIYYGKATPRQATVLPIAPYYEEEWARSYAERDVEKANELLDEMGLEWDEKHRRRLRPDGDPVSFNLEYWAGEGPKTSIVELLRESLAEVGIELNAKPQNAGYNRSRLKSGESDTFNWHMDSSTKLYRRCRVFPVNGGFQGIPSVPWFEWLETDGEEGEKPPQKIIEWYNIGQQWKTTTDIDKRHKLAKKMLDIQANQVYWIGTVGRSPTPAVYDKDLVNVPTDGYWGWQLHFWRAYDVSQFFYSDPEKRKIRDDVLPESKK